jgi:2-hydroxycyclohexanecarboxyl-CoA dehydrogenase
MEMDGRVAVVTGGASGMGAAVSQRLATAGAAVAVWDVNVGGARHVAETIAQHGGQAQGFEVDIAAHEAVRDATAEVVKTLGAPSILVNCAGVTSNGAHLLDLSIEEWNRVTSVNLNGPFFTIAELGRVMAQRDGGAIVNISSTAALVGFPRSVAYAASKAGQHGMTRAAAVDLAGHGIRVNTIAPGQTDTPMRRAYVAKSETVGLPSLPAGLLGVGTAEDIAELAYFLVSDASAHITGQIIVCDGGEAINGSPGGVSLSSSVKR